MDLKCQYSVLNKTSSDNGIQITVGDMITAECESFDQIKELSEFKLELPPEKKYELILLKSGQVDKNLRFAFTSYKVGPHQFEKIELKGLNQNLVLSPLNFEVKTVLNKEEKVEPYGPFAGLKMQIPLEYYLVAVGLLISVILYLIGWILIKTKRKRQLNRVLEYENSHTAIQQFHSAYRKLLRIHEFFHLNENQILKNKSEVELKKDYQISIEEIQKAFKVYLLRTFKIHIFEVSFKVFMKQLKNKNPLVFELKRDEIVNLFSEHEKAILKIEKLNNKDVIQIVEKTRMIAEQVDMIVDAIQRNDKLMLKKLKGGN